MGHQAHTDSYYWTTFLRLIQSSLPPLTVPWLMRERAGTTEPSQITTMIRLNPTGATSLPSKNGEKSIPASFLEAQGPSTSQSSADEVCVIQTARALNAEDGPVLPPLL